MEFGQLMEYHKRNVLNQSCSKNETGRIVPDLFLSFKKALNEVKAWLST